MEAAKNLVTTGQSGESLSSFTFRGNQPIVHLSSVILYQVWLSIPLPVSLSYQSQQHNWNFQMKKWFDTKPQKFWFSEWFLQNSFVLKGLALKSVSVWNIKRKNILVPFKTNYFSHFLFNTQSNYHLWKVFWYDRVISFPKQISFNNTETFRQCSNTIGLKFNSIQYSK